MTSIQFRACAACASGDSPPPPVQCGGWRIRWIKNASAGRKDLGDGLFATWSRAPASAVPGPCSSCSTCAPSTASRTRMKFVFRKSLRGLRTAWNAQSHALRISHQQGGSKLLHLLACKTYAKREKEFKQQTKEETAHRGVCQNPLETLEIDTEGQGFEAKYGSPRLSKFRVRSFFLSQLRKTICRSGGSTHPDLQTNNTPTHPPT